MDLPDDAMFKIFNHLNYNTLQKYKVDRSTYKSVDDYMSYLKSYFDGKVSPGLHTPLSVIVKAFKFVSPSTEPSILKKIVIENKPVFEDDFYYSNSNYSDDEISKSIEKFNGENMKCLSMSSKDGAFEVKLFYLNGELKSVFYYAKPSSFNYSNLGFVENPERFNEYTVTSQDWNRGKLVSFFDRTPLSSGKNVKLPSLSPRGKKGSIVQPFFILKKNNIHPRNFTTDEYGTNIIAFIMKDFRHVINVSKFLELAQLLNVSPDEIFKMFQGVVILSAKNDSALVFDEGIDSPPIHLKHPNIELLGSSNRVLYLEKNNNNN